MPPENSLLETRLASHRYWYRSSLLYQLRHLDYGKIVLSDYGPDYQPQGITKRMRQIAGDWERAGITIEMATDLLQARWQKLVWNIPFNGLSVVLDARTDEMMASLEIRNLVEQLMREVVAGAERCDRHIPDSFIDKMLDYTDKTSMKLDYEGGSRSNLWQPLTGGHQCRC